MLRPAFQTTTGLYVSCSGMPICPAARETPITQPALFGTHFHRPVNVAFDQQDSSSDVGAILLKNVRCLILV
jgi:hypothetical protein